MASVASSTSANYVEVKRKLGGFFKVKNMPSVLAWKCIRSEGRDENSFVSQIFHIFVNT